LLGVATRDFDIKDGSSIKFNGDVMDSDLDINAVYTTKASLSGLIADTTSVGSRRTVECTLNIYDKLRNPQLGFAIDIPDIDPITRASVESALNTEDKIQKQFVALLVGNSFIPDEQSGIVNTSSMLYSNVAGIMASQLSNILQRLHIPLDLGLKYQPNEGGTDIFDVAISTELFNNRVVVNGAIGNRMYGSKSNSDVVGDLDIEVKLDRSGAWRLTLFSHSVDQYTNYLDDSQRNGVGMAYQKEFNTFQELWKAIFTRKKKGTEEEFVVEEVPKTTFSIE
ncbi:MAG: translocation/assembly module TamB domain-containing protein, partial [Bacteroidales bacterium]|nr:translocation/assembly module TamB domain-containing protein [Bacteroidales bacterium]